MDVANMVMWWAGISVTGFLFLAGWMWWLVGQINQRVTYQDFSKGISEVASVLREIKDAIVGDLKSEGLLSRTRKIEENCVRQHGEALKRS